jgi:hypothetical protein
MNLRAGQVITGASISAMFGSWVIGPAITFALVDFVLPLALAVEIGHRGQSA